jgi:RNase P protein component
LLDGLTGRFRECAAEKNCTLIRCDIIVVLRKVYDEAHDEKIRETAEELIATEKDLKYRKKYATAWRKK